MAEMSPKAPNLVAVTNIRAMMNPYMASCMIIPGPACLTRNRAVLENISAYQWKWPRQGPVMVDQTSLKAIEYSIFFAPKYSLQNLAVLSGRNCLQENTSMNALLVSSAKCPEIWDVSINWIRE